MPLRVKCRCGQELVVRQSEWLYVFLGIALLSLLLNAIVLILLYFRLESAPSSGVRGATVLRESMAPMPRSLGLESPDDSTEHRSSSGEAVGSKGLPAAIASASHPEGAPAALPTSAQSSPTAPKDPLRSSGGESAVLEPLSSILERARLPQAAALSLIAADAQSERAMPGSSKGTAQQSGVDDRTPPQVHEPIATGGPLARLHLLEREPFDAQVACALLLDPDVLIRRRAMDKLLARGGFALMTGPAQGEARALISAAAPVIGKCAQGQSLLASLSLAGESQVNTRGGSPEAPLAVGAAEILNGIRAQLSKEVFSSAVAQFRNRLESMASSGVDMVLAIDISQSMEGPLLELQRESLWFLPALAWSLPGVRVGLMLFRDSVEAEVDLSTNPAGDVLRVLREARAEGGGDVPEGVHEALRAALSLGRARWKEAADKHILLLGDGSPPYAQVSGLLSILRQANLQGGYHVHSLSMNPGEGRFPVPIFPEIAKAGGGRSVTVADARRTGEELFRCLFSDEARPALEQVLPALLALFSSGG